VDIKKDTETRKIFIDILFKLSNSQEILESSSERSKVYLQLEEIYHQKKFRHYYSDIFSVLTTLKNESDVGDINILGQNLEIIRNGYKSVNFDENGNPIDISENIKKLYDHVSLDIARISYSEGENRKVSQEETIDDLKAKINLLQEKINSSQKTVDDTSSKIESFQKRMDSTQKEYVAILGIFASVVLTFIGGIVFSSSVLQNFHNSSIYRISFICLVLGLVLFNILYFLFYFIERIVKDKATINKKLFYIVNSIVVVLIGLIFICWRFGVVENRDNNFSKNNSVISTSNTANNETNTNNTESKIETQNESK
jgi:hypothetical protein